MAIFRLYADILDYLYRNPDDMHGGSLEEITACHPHFAYYGARETLANLLEGRAQKVNTSVEEWYGSMAGELWQLPRLRARVQVNRFTWRWRDY